jgi:hypothetical protein
VDVGAEIEVTKIARVSHGYASRLRWQIKVVLPFAFSCKFGGNQTKFRFGGARALSLFKGKFLSFQRGDYEHGHSRFLGSTITWADPHSVP